MKVRMISKVTFLVIMVFLIAVVGCTSAENENVNGSVNGNENIGQEGVTLRIGSGPTGGTWYPIGVLTAEIIKNENPNYDAVAEVTDISAAIIRQLTANELDIGVNYSANLNWALNSEEMFEGENHDLQVLMAGYVAPMALIVREDSDIYSWPDVKGKNISGPFPGGLISWKFIDAVLEHYDLTRDDLASLPASPGIVDTIEQIKIGDLDGVQWAMVGSGGAAFLELAETTKLRTIGLDEEALEFVKSELPMMVESTQVCPLSGDEYTTLCDVFIFAIRPEVDEEVAYNVIKAIMENAHRYEEVLDKNVAEQFTLENAAQFKDKLPYHPGAIRYYEEQGVW